MKVPTGKGGRLIMCYTECVRYEFFKKAKLVYHSNTGNSTDYYNQINTEILKKWFIELLNNSEESLIIVMDNTSYHSTSIENHL